MPLGVWRLILLSLEASENLEPAGRLVMATRKYELEQPREEADVSAESPLASRTRSGGQFPRTRDLLVLGP